MARFKGFSTIDRYKKFTVTDNELVKRNLLNLLSIREGELPGKPDVGTRIWNFIFEARTPDLIRKITKELERVTRYDLRLTLNDVVVTTDEHTVVLELNVTINPNRNPETVWVEFNEETNTVNIV